MIIRDDRGKRLELTATRLTELDKSVPYFVQLKDIKSSLRVGSSQVKISSVRKRLAVGPGDERIRHVAVLGFYTRSRTIGCCSFSAHTWSRIMAAARRAK
jgi:hypothetical protein